MLFLLVEVCVVKEAKYAHMQMQICLSSMEMWVSLWELHLKFSETKNSKQGNFFKIYFVA